MEAGREEKSKGFFWQQHPDNWRDSFSNIFLKARIVLGILSKYPNFFITWSSLVSTLEAGWNLKIIRWIKWDESGLRSGIWHWATLLSVNPFACQLRYCQIRFSQNCPKDTPKVYLFFCKGGYKSVVSICLICSWSQNQLGIHFS